MGKTTLLRHLEGLGETVVEENARAVIREQVLGGGTGTPWLDNDLFVSLTTVRDIADFDRLADQTGRVFFDRGIMDMYGANGAVPFPALIEAIRTRRYNPTVFVFPPWPEIYETDSERRQDWAEAERTFDQVMTTLLRLDYAPLVVPKSDLESRAAFVLAACA